MTIMAAAISFRAGPSLTPRVAMISCNNKGMGVKYTTCFIRQLSLSLLALQILLLKFKVYLPIFLTEEALCV